MYSFLKCDNGPKGYPDKINDPLGDELVLNDEL